MRFQPLLATILFPLAFADTANSPGLELANVTFNSYYTFVSPSAAGPKLGSISFAIVNDAVDEPVLCDGYSTNPWAMFYPSEEFYCDYPESSGYTECWTSSASFYLDTMTPGEMNLTVQLSWTCAGQGVYTFTAWENLNLDCLSWTCTNDIWPKNTIYSNTTTVCEQDSVNFGGGGAKAQKVG
ncbi:hypothetical protein PTNB73_05187 [Pyrenophora teres f. teres]|uniref:AltA1 domain containing protein n=1 Tax=Pyrenophora teres f. teres TaxID=97479 RepID=A0A6S6W0G2_9PLEO|nr:hypothetical protein HRS9139_05243 [Pyrenophora teres f. teres]CAA9961104.1 AltA1 domain containing protein [Pyrenophora teres f. maculata]KAE8840807.1 hypothetical protein PTNB85_04206 [Pyrenophora teres f. teres]KAE8864303.1 hypothetical protein PTNB29_04267 [Pyrenophora teres f. teres]KAE8867093.1 hypothetical protein PTNB73_05187 [Pyrenophora teres f. teres]